MQKNIRLHAVSPAIVRFAVGFAPPSAILAHQQELLFVFLIKY